MASHSESFDFKVPGYVLEKLIVAHRGSSIHRGYRETDDQPVVLKVVMNALAAPVTMTRLDHEYRLLADIQSDYVPMALDLVRFDGGSALVQNDMGPINIQEILAGEETLDLNRGLTFALDLLDTLADIHQQNIIHKDITPSNIIWDGTTRKPALVDFGISTYFSHQRYHFSSTRGVEGTLRYIAPEQTGRMNRELDYRSDYYSLGVVLYELFTGSCPFEMSDPLALIHAHLAQSPPPAHERNQNVPPSLSQILDKLLAKSASDRYQSIPGIRADLQQCLDNVTANHSQDVFTLGTSDASAHFQLPQKLYGRGPQQEEVIQSFQNITRGTRAVLMVAGKPGIGKSALVQESHIEITRAGGYYCSGKFDQLQRTTPYSALVQACTHLLQQTLLVDDEQQEQWKHKLLPALGHNAQVMIDFLPDLQVLGPQSPLQALGPVETQNRFKRVFTNFLKVFCQADHPVLLFLDDLQWADLGTLKLLEHLLVRSDLKHLLVVGCYRNNEITETHPLSHLLQTFAESHVNLQSMELGPLDVAAIQEVVTDLFPRLSCETKALSHLLQEKTDGNPFFLGQFLQGLHQDQLAVFDTSAHCWTVDLDVVRETAMTDNVVDYMVGQLHKLPDRCRRALAAASCIGNRFDIDLLAHVLQDEATTLHQDLYPAVEGRLIAPQLDSLTSLKSKADAPQSVYRTYDFIHDRVQQAAHLLTDIDPQHVHHQIGQVLLQNRSTHHDVEYLFTLVDHLNGAGIGGSENPEGKILIQLNLEAAEAAKQATAYDAALTYLQACATGLERDQWAKHRDWAYQLCYAMAEVYYLLNQRDKSAPWMEHALGQASSLLEKARVHNLAVTYLAMNGQYHESLDRALETLRLLGVDIRIDNPEAAIGAVFKEIESRVDEHNIAALYEREDVTDPIMQYAMKILAEITSVSYAIDKRIFVLVNANTVLLALKHGLCADAAPSIACLGLLYNAMFGKPELGCEYGTLGKRLGDRYDDLAQRSKAYDWYCNFTVVWNEPLKNTIPLNREALSLALDTGDLPFAGFIVNHMAYNSFYMGMNLKELQEAAQGYLDFLDRISHFYAYDCVQGILWAIEHLTSNTDEPMRIPESKTAFLERCNAPETMFPLGRYLALLTQIYVLENNAEAAWQTAQDSLTHLVDVTGTLSVAGQGFYYFMAGALFADTLTGESRSQHIAQLRELSKPIYGWAQRSPSSFGHMSALVDAEFARLDGQTENALLHYDTAITTAREHGTLHDEALACERAAQFWKQQGKDRLALPYLREAYHAHERWGCTRRASTLQRLLPTLGTSRPTGNVSETTPVTMSDSLQSDSLDLVELLKSVRVISEAANLDQLLDRMMKLLLEDAGASRGCLLLAHEGALHLQACANIESNTVEIFTNHPLPLPQAVEQQQLPQRLIDQVCKQKVSVIINRQEEFLPFRADTSTSFTCPRSAICLPICKQNELYGLLYLENRDLEDAFTADRIQILQALSGQMTVSIENALLYQDLENRVAQRTEELHQANTSLHSTNLDLKNEIEERERAQRERDALQAQLLDTAHRAGMAEIATGVLHNIGNAINSVNVRLEAVKQNTEDTASLRINDLATLIQEHQADLGHFLTDDPKGQLVPAYIVELATALTERQREQLAHLDYLHEMVAHVSDIVARQNSYTGVSGVREKRTPQALVEDALKIIRDSLETPEISIQSDVSADLPSVEVESHRAVQILINLIKNAAQAIEETGRCDGCIRITAQETEGQICLCVEDNGIGIAPDKQEQVFQFGYTTKSDSHGFGLHTSILNARELGGDLSVSSAGTGQGTTFSLMLPTTEAVEV
ncbi:AAA family ATPase [Planctomycetota bacterium]